jgi:hypothetical protein
MCSFPPIPVPVGTIFSHERATEAPNREEQHPSAASPAPSEGEAESSPKRTETASDVWTCDMCTFDNPYSLPAQFYAFQSNGLTQCVCVCMYVCTGTTLSCAACVTLPVFFSLRHDVSPSPLLNLLRLINLLFHRIRGRHG